MQTTFVSGGKSIRLDVFEPHSPRPQPAILLLHGAGGNTNFWLDQLTPAIAHFGVAVYAVHYFESTGTLRADFQTLSDGIHVPLWLATIRDAIAHIAKRPNVDPRRIALVGISLGAFLSLAVATLPDTPPIKAIADISGGLVAPYDANATANFPPTLILHGDADSVVPISHAHELDVLLTRLNVAHEIQIFRGEGHWFSSAAQMRILAALAAFFGRHL